MPVLYPYQDQGSDWLAERSAGYLGDDPGLGKTAQIITAADRVDARRILVVCPASLKVNWAREFDKFSTRRRPVCIPGSQDLVPATGPLVCMVNYELAAGRGRQRPLLHKRLSDQGWDVMAMDEGHALKDPASRRTRALLGQHGLYKNADHVWPMSGTPMPNHMGELYPYLAALYPQATRGMDYDRWLRHYLRVEEGAYGPRVLGNRSTITQFKEDLDGFMLRRRRWEVLKDLPDLRTARLTVENDSALAAINAVELDDEDHELLQALLGGEVDDSALDAMDELYLATLRRLCGEAKAHALVDEVADELQGGVGKIVLMCWHRSTMDILQGGLARFGVARIDGSTKNRQAEVDRFQNPDYSTSCRVFVGQIQAAGTGHTLTAAKDMIIVEPSWTPGDNLQAMLRIHRIGQTQDCLIRFAALAGSIDETIMAVAQRKADMLAEIFG